MEFLQCSFFLKTDSCLGFVGASAGDYRRTFHPGIEKTLVHIAIFFALMCSVLLASPLGAQAVDEPIVLEEIVITATRSEESSLDVPAQVTVISREEIEASPATNLAELLDAQAGASSADYGPEGALKTISIRGSTSSQVLVLVDGIRVNNSQSGSADLALIGLENVERIEVVRGGLSALYGADAVGGVINIVTRRNAENGFKVSFESGGFIPEQRLTGKGSTERKVQAQLQDLVDSQKAAVQVDLAGEALDFVSTASFTRAANAYSFTDLTGKRRRRDNADLLGGDFSANLRYAFQNGSVRLGGSGLYQDKGVPGAVGSLSLDTRQRDLVVRGSAALFSDVLFTDLLTFDLKAHYTYSRLEYEDFGSSVLSIHQVHSSGVDAAQELFALDWLSLLYGGNLSFEQIESTELSSRQRLFAAGFLQTSLYPWPALLLQPVVRYDYYSDFGGMASGKLGGVLSVGPYAALKAGVSSAFRAPTFNDLYWPEDVFAEGNPDLKPETGYSAELGFDVEHQRFRQSLALYGRYVREVILWQPGMDGKWRPSNYGEGLYMGLDGNWEARLWERLSLFTNYSFLLSYALSGDLTLKDNRRLPNLPIHSLDGGLTYRDPSNTFSIQGHYQSLRYLKIDNEDTLPAYFTVNLRYQRRFSTGYALWLNIENLFDAEYEVVSGYPIPGFAFRIGMEYSR